MNSSGFTLAEILVSLAILGVIATFTIPKVLQNQADGRYKAVAKESAGTISAAYQSYRVANGVNSAMTLYNLTPYLNYTKIDTSGVLIDNTYTQTSYTCDNSRPCIRLHSGAAMIFSESSFGGTATTNGLWFDVDPDGVYSGTTNSGGKSVEFWLYPDGYVTDTGNVRTNTTNTLFGPYAPSPGQMPPWFSWN
jgi:prepilin-type N-terminal cleavage/methylation domain-containing protein